MNIESKVIDLKQTGKKTEPQPSAHRLRGISGGWAMKTKLILLLAVLWCGLSAINLAAVTIVQGVGSTAVAFEADTTASILPGTPETWVSTNDAAASGGTALYADGVNTTGTSPHSFAQYQIKFTEVGTYYLYSRWKADPSRTAGDAFTANSTWFPLVFGAYSTPGDQAPFYRSASNGGSAPSDNVFDWTREPDANVYPVAAGDLSAPLLFTIGTREAGMVIDRFVFSTVPDLTDAQLDALVNSDTDFVLQDPGTSFASFEADGTKAKILAGTPETWVSTNDAAASGGTALYADGVNTTGTSPHSFAQYQIKFTEVGTYYLYSRWKADPSRTAGDAFTANSTWFPLVFGAYSTPGDQAPFYRSKSNDGSAPSDNVFDWALETAATYPVAAGDLSAPLLFTIGTREAGMVIDRFVFSTVPDLTDAQLDALPNSGVQAVAPKIKTTVGSSSLTTVTVTFTRPLASASVVATNFTLSGGVTVNGATLDANDARIVELTTTAQTQGTVYTLTVNNVTDTGGTPIVAGSTATFTAWKIVAGWTLKEIYFGITGDFVADLTAAPNFQAKPDRVQWVKGFQLNQDPLTDNYGARLTTFFTPPAAGAYEFFIYNDNEAELFLSPNTSPASLASFGLSPTSLPPFAEPAFGTSPALAAGQSYLLQGLLKQGGGDVYFDVAVRPQGSVTPPATLPVLAGNQIATWVNPDLGAVTFNQQPANVTTTAGSRARFAVKVTTAESPVYFQWRANGVPIAGATLAAYVTPVLTVGNSGVTYDVVVSVAGRDTASTSAALTVNPGQPLNLQPYLGLNLVGGGTSGGATLAPVTVAGVVPQENWNNLTGFTFDQVVLADAGGGATPVTLTTDPSPNAPTEVWYSGTKSVNDGDGLLLQGFVSGGASIDPVVFRLNNVPAGNYNLLVYSVGFDFTPNYLQAYSVAGAASYPTYHGRAETGLNYLSNPAFRRMTTTTTNAPSSGNYVQFDSVSPAGDGSLAVSVTWEPQDAGINNSHQPAINAIQLVRVNPITTPPTLGATVGSPGTLTVSWSALATGYTLQSSPTLGAAASWTAVAGTPNPITGAGSAIVNTTSGGGAYYRLFKP